MTLHKQQGRLGCPFEYLTLILFALSTPAGKAQTLGEALNATNLTWTTGGAIPWVVASDISQDGVASASPGLIPQSADNWLETTVAGPTAVTFWWRSTPCGPLSVSVGGTSQASISGNKDWQWRSIYVPPGAYAVRWTSSQNCLTPYTTNAAWLDMVELASPVAPWITGEPTNQTLLAGSGVTNRVAAAGTEPFTFIWEKNGAIVAGATRSSYAITNAQAGDAGSYRVIVSNLVGSVTSQVATVSVDPSIPRFTILPASRGAAIGAPAVFRAAAAGTEPISWQWYSNGVAMTGANSPVLTLSNITTNSFGDYMVVATNALDCSTSAVVKLVYSPVVGWGLNSSGQMEFPASTSNAVAVAGGDRHGIVLRSDGAVVCWGDGTWGQTQVPPDATNVTSIAAGSTHSLAVRTNGLAKQWGNVIFTTISSAPPDATNIVLVAQGPGAQRCLALRRDGTPRQWGAVHYLDWVTRSATNDPPPEAVGLVGIAAGAFHCVGLRGDGTLVAWGDNSYQQLNIPPSATNVVAISSGWYHNLALRADGKLVAWGTGSSGHVPGPVPVAASNIISFACGGDGFNLALKADGKLYTWGWNQDGQLNRPAWATNLAAVSALSYSSLALIGVGPPTITSPLVDRSVVNGRSAFFYVTAVGAWPLAYQWQRDGEDLPGATNLVLVVTNAQPSDSGVYSVVVTNLLGQAVSPGARLTVLAKEAHFISEAFTPTDGLFTMTATSPPGLVWKLQSSPNLLAWSDAGMQTNRSGTMSFSVPATNTVQGFFRLTLAE